MMKGKTHGGGSDRTEMEKDVWKIIRLALIEIAAAWLVPPRRKVDHSVGMDSIRQTACAAMQSFSTRALP